MVGVAAGVMATVVAGPAFAADPGTVFSDGFESGTMAGYYKVASGSASAPVDNSMVKHAIVRTGSSAWRATNPNGVPAYAYRALPASYNELWAGAWVYLASRASTVKLFALRQAYRGQSIDVYVDQRGLVSVRNNIGGTTTYSTTTLASGGWHRVVLHAKAGTTTGSFDVSVDGAPVPGLSRTGQNVGSSPFGDLRLGDIAVAATFDLVLDDILVSTTPQ